MIHAARQRAYQAVNTELIDLYWRIGEYLHHKIESDGWAKGTVVQLGAYIAQREPGLRGFSPQNLWRMRQFFEVYSDDSKLSPLVRVLPWTHNLIISGSPAHQTFNQSKKSMKLASTAHRACASSYQMCSNNGQNMLCTGA